MVELGKVGVSFEVDRAREEEELLSNQLDLKVWRGILKKLKRDSKRPIHFLYDFKIS